MPTETILGDTGLVQMDAGTHENTWADVINANFAIVDALFDGTAGHDHSEDGKGAPIPTVGLLGLGAATDGLVRADGAGAFEVATFGPGLDLVDGALSIDIHEVTEKTAPVSADEILIADSADSFALKRVLRSKLLTGAVLPGTPYAHNALGSVSGTVTLELDKYGSFSFTPTGTVTIALTGAVTGVLYVAAVEITNAAAFTLNDPSGAKWPGGARPSLTASGVDVLFVSTRDGGTTSRWTAEVDSR